MAAHYGLHPLGRSVLGTTESVTALTRDQMMAYFLSRYSPKNIVLAAAGNVDFPALIATADKHCGSWEPFEAPRDLLIPPANKGFKVVHKPLAVQQYVVQAANAPAAADEDRYAARLAAMILGDDSGSRLFWELIDSGLAEYAAIGAHEFQGCGPVHDQPLLRSRASGREPGTSRRPDPRIRNGGRHGRRAGPGEEQSLCATLCCNPSGPRAGSRPSATVGCSDGNIAPCGKRWRRIEPSRSTTSRRSSKSIRSA